MESEWPILWTMMNFVFWWMIPWFNNLVTIIGIHKIQICTSAVSADSNKILFARRYDNSSQWRAELRHRPLNLTESIDNGIKICWRMSFSSCIWCAMLLFELSSSRQMVWSVFLKKARLGSRFSRKILVHVSVRQQVFWCDITCVSIQASFHNSANKRQIFNNGRAQGKTARATERK